MNQIAYSIITIPATVYNSKIHRLKTPEQRFWERVDKNGPIPKHAPDLGPCWIWIGPTRKGYGAHHIKRVKISTHRLSFIYTFGNIASEELILHRCDNPICCNPSHLRKGTTQDNVDDRVFKGRNRNQNGSKNNQAKLKEIDVLKIKKLISYGIRCGDIGKQFNVTRKCICKIKNGRSWLHVI